MITYVDFLAEISRLPVYDTHEHFMPESELAENSPDFFDLLFPYICDDLMSAGMSGDALKSLRDRNLPFHRRWVIFESYYPYIRHGSYFRALNKSLTAMGMSNFDEAGALALNRYLTEQCKIGCYQKLAAELGIVKTNVILDDYRLAEGYDSDLFACIPTLSMFCPANSNDINRIEDICHQPVNELRDLDKALENLFLDYEKHNIRAIKLGSAYVRELDFKEGDPVNAAQVLLDLKNGMACRKNSLQLDEKIVDFERIKPLDDYLIWKILTLAKLRKFDVHIHTGLHAWNYNNPTRCHADRLQHVISSFPDIRFVLLHAGIPYIDDALLLAKYYPNVILNLTWTHIIDRVKTQELIERILEMIPVNKVQGFGGDFLYPQNVRGNLEMARENIAAVLFKKITAKEMTYAEAIQVAASWLVFDPEGPHT